MNLTAKTYKCQVKVMVNRGDRKVSKRVTDPKQLEVAKSQDVAKQQHNRGTNDFIRENTRRVLEQVPPPNSKKITPL